MKDIHYNIKRREHLLYLQDQKILSNKGNTFQPDWGIRSTNKLDIQPTQERMQILQNKGHSFYAIKDTHSPLFGDFNVERHFYPWLKLNEIEI